jgi:integrase
MTEGYRETFRKSKISSRLVTSLKLGETVMDTELSGYGVRRQKSKDCVFFVKKSFKRARHYETIGIYGDEWTEPKARDAALKIIAAIKNGADISGAKAKARAMPTLAEFAAEVIENRAPTLKPTTNANYRAFLRRHVAPTDNNGKLLPGCLGRLKVDAVQKSDVTTLHRKLQHMPRGANQVLALLGVIFDEAREAKLLSEGAANPARRIKKYPESLRDRFLTQEEFERLGETLRAIESDGSEDPYAVMAIRLLIFAGSRRNEILSAKWSWIDFERGFLNLPSAKTGRRPVPLSLQALELLRLIPRVVGNPYVIVGKKRGQHLVGLNHIWQRIRKRADLKPVILEDGKEQHVRLHDLRHSFASLAAANGESLQVIGKLLGHTNPMTTARYAHLVGDQIHAAGNDVGERVAPSIMPTQKLANREIVSATVDE